MYDQTQDTRGKLKSFGFGLQYCSCTCDLLLHCVNPALAMQCLITLGVIVDIFHFSRLRWAGGRGVTEKGGRRRGGERERK